MIEILIPYATLEPIKDLLLQMFMGEKFGRDSIWETHLGKEVRSTQLGLDALLGQKMVKMSDVINLKIGSTIILEKEPDEDITLMASGIPMMTGKLGKLGDKKAIKIGEIVNKRMKEIM